MAHWGYCSHNGPTTWANNVPAAGGKRQSPIDIVPSDAVYDESLAKNPLQIKHSAASVKELINNGHSVQACYDFAGSSLKGGPLSNEYQLAQFHFHWGRTSSSGSEHTLNGKMFPSEVHLVHVNTEKYKTAEEAVKHADGLCVLGVFLQIGKEHKGLQTLIDNFNKIKYSGEKVQLSQFDPGCLLPENKLEYWTYPGSLTTPPCLECVTWVVFKNPIEVSESQLAAFRSLQTVKQGESAPADEELKGQMIENYRPPCDLNGRQLRATFK